MRTRRFLPLLVATTLTVLFTLTQDRPLRASARSAAVGDYVGSDTCATCHEEASHRFKGTIMGRVFAEPRTKEEKLGCEVCHGPGKAHVEAGGGKGTIPLRFAKDANETAEQKNAACITCHRKGNRMFWEGSPHESRGLACVDCHQVMTPKTVSLSSENRYRAPLGDVRSLKHEQPELCLQCHQMRRAQLQRSSHMPFPRRKSHMHQLSQSARHA